MKTEGEREGEKKSEEAGCIHELPGKSLNSQPTNKETILARLKAVKVRVRARCT